MRVDYSQEIKGPEIGRKGEIGGVLLLALAVFSLFSLVFQDTGSFGQWLRLALLFTLGQAASVVCFLGIFMGWTLIRGKSRSIKWRQCFGFFLLALALITFFHLAAVYLFRGYHMPPNLVEEYTYAKEATNGLGSGVVGAVLMTLLLTGFGISGSYVVIAAAILISLPLTLDKGLVEVLQWLGRLLRESGNQFALRLGRGWFSLKERCSRPALAPSDWPSSEARDIPGTPPATATAVAERKSDEPPQEAEDTGKRRSTKQQGAKGSSRQMPPVFLLKRSRTKLDADQEDGGQQSLLEKTLASFQIDAKVVNICQGPVVTRYEIQPSPGIKVNRITALADNLALALAAEGVRIEAPVPGKSVIGIEVPNKTRQTVAFRDLIETSEFRNSRSGVTLALGKDISGNPVIADLKEWLHLLIAGATGSGKSVCLNSVICSILYKATPEDVKFLMIDPKRVELALFAGIPHLIAPVVTDAKKAASCLNWAVSEMDRRYRMFEESGVKNIDGYQALPRVTADGVERERMPYIVIVIDELADLMMVSAKEVESLICRLAQLARAAGMYLVIATQRPSADVITGLIKTNIPSRIAFAVSSNTDSRIILDMGGAERLIGRGDMLYHPRVASKAMRAQGAWIDEREVEAIVKHWKNQAEPQYQEVQAEVVQDESQEQSGDELLDEAIRFVVETGQASVTMLQRRFPIGYNRAGRLIDAMEKMGIVGPSKGSKARDVLVDSTYLEEER